MVEVDHSRPTAGRMLLDRMRGSVHGPGVIMLLPMLVLFLALQRRFVAGLTATGLKG